MNGYFILFNLKSILHHTINKSKSIGMADFYSFNIKYEAQKRNNWCWCACFSWIVKAFDTHDLYKDQWQILYYYLKIIRNELKITLDKHLIETVSEYNTTIDTNSNHVNSLITELLKFEYEEICLLEYGDERFQKLDAILNFENIKNCLVQNKTPIIISTFTHMLIVSGYGKNECGEFILISDPFKGERYWSIRDFITSYRTEIFKIWVLRGHVRRELSKDLFIDYVSSQNRFLRNIVSEHPINKVFKKDSLFLISLVSQVNDTFLKYRGDNYEELKAIVFETIIASNNKKYCDAYMKKGEIDNIGHISKFLEQFLREGKTEIDLNQLLIFNPDNQLTSRITVIKRDGKLQGVHGNREIDYTQALKEININ